jgi:hypothetical protein
VPTRPALHLAEATERLGPTRRRGTDDPIERRRARSGRRGIPVVRPHCQPGDALLFDELCLHANGGDQAGLTRERYALEAWMFAPSGKPGHYLPILV